MVDELAEKGRQIALLALIVSLDTASLAELTTAADLLQDLADAHHVGDRVTDVIDACTRVIRFESSLRATALTAIEADARTRSNRPRPGRLSTQMGDRSNKRWTVAPDT